MLRPARRLPKRYARPVSKETKRLLRRKHKKAKGRWRDSLHRIQRRGQRTLKASGRSLLWWLLSLFIVLLVVAFCILIFSPLVQVREIKVVREDARLDIEEVQRVLAPYFGKRMFFLPGREVEELLKATLKDIENIHVAKVYPSQLYVRVALDPLSAKLIIVDPDIEEEETATGALIDFLTEEGVYVIAPLLEGRELLPVIYLVDWGVRPVVGDRLLASAFLERMAETERSLAEQFGHRIEKRTAFLRAQEYHLRIENEIELWFDMRSELEAQLLKYRTFLRSVDLGTVEGYVDLRLSDRVVYK